MNPSPQLYIDSKPVRLGKRLGKGGEGEVFALADLDGYAVKIYAAPDARREAKIKAMIDGGLAKGSNLIAFPTSVLRDRQGIFAGFVMRMVSGHTSLHDLYAPGSRKIHFPKADYRFTIRAAANIARAVAKVHDLGAVIGDINHSGILISKEAVAALIDADSFQFGRDHLCRVGVAEYTPPELQGQRLDGIVRTPNHDAFGLAVVIFQLLFMGRHPFMGRYARGDMPVEKAITEHRFAYSKLRDTGMTPPPGACQLDDFPTFIRTAMEAAFAPAATARPTAHQWVKLLEELEGALSKCSANAMHFFPSAAGKCVWCRMEQQIGILLFLPSFELGAGASPSDPGAAGFNLAAVWAAIERVKIPDPNTFSPVLVSPTFSVSDEARSCKRDRLGQRWVGLLLIGAAIAVLATLSVLWFVYIPLGLFGAAKAFGSDMGDGGKFQLRYQQAEKAMLDAIDGWRQRVGIVEMQELREALSEAKTRLEQLPAIEQRRLAEHEATRRDSQLHNYLETFPIWRAKIRGVGPAKLAALSSYGIDTAADLVLSRIVSVPGFGEATAQPLIQWRRKLESKFVFRPQPSQAELHEVQRIRQNLATEAGQLRAKLLKGAADLQNAVVTLQARAQAPDPAINRAHAEREQARADLKFLQLPEPKMIARPKPATVPPRAPYHVTRKPTSPASRPVSPAGGVSCPTCGGRMVKRLARRGRNAGGHFWGCAAYPRCKGTRSI